MLVLWSTSVKVTHARRLVLAGRKPTTKFGGHMPKDRDGRYRDKYCNEMDFHEFLDWAKGYVLLEIGRGNFAGAMALVVSQAYTNATNAEKAKQEKAK
jgi:hypothetical protein